LAAAIPDDDGNGCAREQGQADRDPKLYLASLEGVHSFILAED
jgi:hypothetical protein